MAKNIKVPLVTQLYEPTTGPENNWCGHVMTECQRQFKFMENQTFASYMWMWENCLFAIVYGGRTDRQ